VRSFCAAGNTADYEPRPRAWSLREEQQHLAFELRELVRAAAEVGQATRLALAGTQAWRLNALRRGTSAAVRRVLRSTVVNTRLARDHAASAVQLIRQAAPLARAASRSFNRLGPQGEGPPEAQHHTRKRCSRAARRYQAAVVELEQATSHFEAADLRVLYVTDLLGTAFQQCTTAQEPAVLRAERAVELLRLDQCALLQEARCVVASRRDILSRVVGRWRFAASATRHPFPVLEYPYPEGGP
jgi:hypothetical protein